MPLDDPEHEPDAVRIGQRLRLEPHRDAVIAFGLIERLNGGPQVGEDLLAQFLSFHVGDRFLDGGVGKGLVSPDRDPVDHRHRREQIFEAYAVLVRKGFYADVAKQILEIEIFDAFAELVRREGGARLGQYQRQEPLRFRPGIALVVFQHHLGEGKAEEPRSPGRRGKEERQGEEREACHEPAPRFHEEFCNIPAGQCKGKSTQTGAAAEVFEAESRCKLRLIIPGWYVTVVAVAAAGGAAYFGTGRRRGLEQDIEKIKAIIDEKGSRFRSRMGDVVFAGVDGGTVKIAPTGFCWR